MHIFHKWKFKNLSNGQTFEYSSDNLPIATWTRVIYVCSCGKRKVKKFDGIWEEKDFI
jgi:hypothetical protein